MLLILCTTDWMTSRMLKKFNFKEDEMEDNDDFLGGQRKNVAKGYDDGFAPFSERGNQNRHYHRVKNAEEQDCYEVFSLFSDIFD